MVVGRLPFADASIPATLQKIRTCEAEYPPSLSPPLADLLRRLLRKDPAERIGIAAIKAHPWLADVSWGYLDETIHRFRHRAADCSTDPAILEKMVLLGIDCSALRESLCEGEETELTMIYRILWREKVTERMKSCTAILRVSAEGLYPAHGKAWTPGADGLGGAPAKPAHQPVARMNAARAVMSLPHGLRLPQLRIMSPTHAFRKAAAKAPAP
jgi:hypothetical protein